MSTAATVVSNSSVFNTLFFAPETCPSHKKRQSPLQSSGCSSGGSNCTYYWSMTSILNNIGVNFTRKPKKTAASPPVSASPPVRSPAGGAVVDGGSGGPLAERVGWDMDVELCVTEEQRSTHMEYSRLVQLPLGFDRQEWLAYHTSFLVRFVGMLWMCSHLPHTCTCVAMTAPHNTIHTYVEERTGKKSTAKHNARNFIEISLHSLERIVLNNEDLFPSKYGREFSAEFEALCARCIRSVYCIVTHLLHAHYPALEQQALHSPLLQLYSYTITFSRGFNLVDKKELAITSALEQALKTTVATTPTEKD